MSLSENSDLCGFSNSTQRSLPRRFNLRPLKFFADKLSPCPSEFSSNSTLTELPDYTCILSRSTRAKRKCHSNSSRKENHVKRKKCVGIQPIRRARASSQSQGLLGKSRSFSQSHSVSDLTGSSRQERIKKRKAFLDRIRAQEPDVERGCVVRSSESDDVLIAEHRAAISTKTLTHAQDEIITVSRLTNSFIGRGGFGEVSAWQITTKDGKVHRVAVKRFDPQDGGLKLAEAEAAVMMEFEKLIKTKMLLWFVPRRLRCFPKDFPYPAIIMPLYENRKCISPSLYNLVFDKRLIKPTLAWITRIGALLLQILVKLHAAGWAHGDLHAGNVILTNRQIVLIDFSKANRKNRPYVYSLANDTDWIKQLDWIEPKAVTGQDCCSRASDIWSFGKLIQVLLEISGASRPQLIRKDSKYLLRLNAVVHLAYHKRLYRPDAQFLLDVLNCKDFATLGICSCQPDCEMLQK